jgi:NTP pyrophosphatase (non-canonical NTP hydrolase)
MEQLDHMQIQLHHWRQRNFPDATAEQQLMGVVEEVGELSHAMLKQMQGIRGKAELHEAEAIDAVGDILIYLMGLCSYRGWSIGKILDETAEMVMQRNWIEDPVTGTDPAKAIELLREDDGYAEDVARAKAEGYDWS